MSAQDASAPAGIQLAREYYHEVAGPLLLARWPGLPHSAGRLGSGSDVLGLDDAMSRDHDWGLRLTLLIDGALVQPVTQYLEEHLPAAYQGWPVRFGTTWDPRPLQRAEVADPDRFVESRLGVPASGLTVLDWLSLTGMSVLEVTAGAVFTDTHGGITRARHQLAWYPDDLWLYVIAADWSRIAQELPFVGRTGTRGDDLGSRVLAGRLAGTLMHLGFLLERRWPPYPKWLGTMFAQLPTASAALPMLIAAVSAGRWQDRQNALTEAIACLHDVQRACGLPAGPQVTEAFFDRPFAGLHESVARLLTDAITDPAVRSLPGGVGSVEQWIDSADVLVPAERRRRVMLAWKQADAG